MPKTKYDDTWLLEQAQKIFAVIGDPEFDEKAEDYTERLIYNSAEESWQLEYQCDWDDWAFYCNVANAFAARFIRDDLREKLEGEQVRIGSVGRIRCVNRSIAGGTLDEYLTKSGFKLIRDMGEVLAFETLSEAIIKAARVVFLGGE